MYEHDFKRHFIWMIWVILGSSILITAFFLMGRASADAAKENRQQEIECLEHGGQMERVPGMSRIACNKK